MTNPTTNISMPRLKTSLIIWCSVALFITMMSVVMIDPLTDLAARVVQCPGAVGTSLESSNGGSVRRSATNSTPMRTLVYTMTCHYPDGSTTIVGNDTRFMSAIGLAVAVGLLAGITIPVSLRIRARIRAALRTRSIDREEMPSYRYKSEV